MKKRKISEEKNSNQKNRKFYTFLALIIYIALKPVDAFTREFDLNFAQGQINSGALNNSQSAVFKALLFDCITGQGCNYNYQIPGGKLQGKFATFVYEEKFGKLGAKLQYKGGKTSSYNQSDANYSFTDSYTTDINNRIGKPDKYDIQLDLSYPIGDYFQLKGGLYYDRLNTNETGFALIFENPKLFKTIEPGTETLLFNSLSQFSDKERGGFFGFALKFPFFEKHSIQVGIVGFQISGKSTQDNLTYPLLPGSSPHTQDFNNSRFTFSTLTTGSIATLKYEWKVFNSISIQLLAENFETRVTSKNANLVGIERDNGVLKFDYTPSFGKESSVGGSKYFNFGAKYYY